MSTGELELGGITWEQLASRKGTFLILDTQDMRTRPKDAWAMIHRDAADSLAPGQERHPDWMFAAVWGGEAPISPTAHPPYDGALLHARMLYYHVCNPDDRTFLEMLSIHNVSWQTWNAACHRITGVPTP